MCESVNKPVAELTQHGFVVLFQEAFLRGGTVLLLQILAFACSQRNTPLFRIERVSVKECVPCVFKSAAPLCDAGWNARHSPAASPPHTGFEHESSVTF